MGMRVEHLPLEVTRTGAAPAPRRVLVVFDASPGAWRALARGIDVAVRERALLTVATVVPEPSLWVGCGLLSIPYTRDTLRRDAVCAMERVLAAARDSVPATVSLTTRLVPGRPRRALAALTRSGDYDLVLTPDSPPRRRRRAARTAVRRDASSRSPASVLAMKTT
jgi:nucleotide-binding universal stress UspA family protein